MDKSPTATTVTVDPRNVNYTHIVYALHATSVVIGILSTSFIVTAFIFGVPSIIAVIMNYLKRADVRGTWLESHFRWQIRTFWLALAGLIASTLVFGPLVLILIGIPLLLLAYIAIGLWVVYRVVRGWVALKDGRTLPNGGA